MVRTYQRKTERQKWSIEAMEQAVTAVINGTMDYKKAADEHKVPVASLERFVQNRKDDDDFRVDNVTATNRCVFTQDQELQLLNDVKVLQKCGTQVTLLKLRKMAYDMAEKLSCLHPFSRATHMAGENWVQNFLYRHKELNLLQTVQGNSLIDLDDKPNPQNNNINFRIDDDLMEQHSSTTSATTSDEISTKPYYKRIRQTLSIEERISVINDYEQNPNIPSLAKRYCSSMQQILTIVMNKDEVLKNIDDSLIKERRQKIVFLNKVMYEYIQRATHQGISINVDKVHNIALEIKESIAIINFYPNVAWMQLFMKNYNIKDFNLTTLSAKWPQRLESKGQQSLKVVDIIEYIRCRNMKKTGVTGTGTETELNELKNMCMRKKRTVISGSQTKAQEEKKISQNFWNFFHTRPNDKTFTDQQLLQVLETYDHLPVYKKVANIFKCPWQQIKDIVRYRELITNAHYSVGETIRTYNTSNKAPNVVLEDTAKEIPKDTQEIPKEAAKEAVKELPKNALKDDTKLNNMLNELSKLERKQQILFMGECVYEYLQRAQYYQKIQIHINTMYSKAQEFSNILNISQFIPNKIWLNHFKKQFNLSLSQRRLLLRRVPPKSLELVDILDYCWSRNDTVTSKNHIPNIDIENREENNENIDVSEIIDNDTRDDIEYAKDYDDVEIDIKPNIDVINELIEKDMFENTKTTDNCKSPTTDMFNEVDIKPNMNEIKIDNIRTIEDTSAASTMRIAIEQIDILSHEDDVDIKPIVDDITIIEVTSAASTNATEQSPNITKLYNDWDVPDQDESEVDETDLDVPDLDVPDLDLSDLDEPEASPVKKLKLESNQVSQSVSVSTEEPVNIFAQLQVNNCTDALNLLRPLEEFAMLDENYRAIGLITQLQELFNKTHGKRL